MLRTLTLIGLAFLTSTVVGDIVFAQQLLPINDSSFYNELAQPEGRSGQDQLINLALSLYQNVRWILGAVGVLMIFVAALRMLTSQGNEDAISSSKRAITWTGFGLVVIAFIFELIPILTLEDGTIIQSPEEIAKRARLFDQSSQIIITFVKYCLASISILFIFRNASFLIAQAENEDTITQARKNITFNAGGLLLIVLADTIIRRTVFIVDLDKAPSAGAEIGISGSEIVAQAVGITNFLVSLAGPLAILALMGGALLYVGSAGNEDLQGRAKRIVTVSIIALVMIYAAFAIVSTFILGTFG